MTAQQLFERMKKIPKVDLHRHLEGSVEPETLLHIARTWGGVLPTGDIERLRRIVQMSGEKPGLKTFLGKFETYRGFYPCREAIEYAVRRAVQAAADDGVVYLELRYSPTHFAARGRFCERDVVAWVHGAMQAAARMCGIIVVPLLTVSRDYGTGPAAATVDLALDLPDGYFYGLDIAGDELSYPAEPFAGLFAKFRARGLGVTIHAGEAGSAANVGLAVERYGALRIGHGIRAADDPGVMSLLRERGVLLEVCLTSNVHTGAVPDLESHPVHTLMRHGVQCSLNTDDPAISSITLSGEYMSARTRLGFSVNDLNEMNRTALGHAFHPDKVWLNKQLGCSWR